MRLPISSAAVLISIVQRNVIAETTSTFQPNIRQATYTYPILQDPVIFNEPPSNASQVPPTQLRGEIYWPSGTLQDGSVPLAILFSGKHPDCRVELSIPGHTPYPWDEGAINANGTCPPNQTVIPGYRGFDYLGKSLASQGIAAISIDPLFLNNSPFEITDDPSLTAPRARLLLKTLEKVRQWNANPKASMAALGFDISRKLDFAKIGFMGHSRGGAGVRMAYNMLMTPERLTVPELVDWRNVLNASVAGVMEVAPLVLPVEGVLPSVVGCPWTLVGAGCESDEIDFEYYPLAEMQGRLNSRPNFFLNVYGANHEYFNTEWHEAVDACLGDQLNTWNSAAPKFNLTLPTGGSVDIPLIQGSTTQQESLRWAIEKFMKTFLGNDLAAFDELRAAPGRSSVTLPNGVEIGLQNPNTGVADSLQDFRNHYLSKVIQAPAGIHLETFEQHAKAQYSLLQSQLERYGPPPFYTTLLQVPALPPFNITLAADVAYENGAILTLPNGPSHPKSNSLVRIQLGSPGAMQHSCTNATIQVDLARRSNCYLRSLAASNGTNKACASPRQRAVQLNILGTTNGQRSIVQPTVANLTSRFNFEWTPKMETESNGTISAEMMLLPVAWETYVLDVHQSCANNTFHNLFLELEIDNSQSAPTNEQVQAHTDRTTDFTASPDFLYVGPVRYLCS